MVKTSKDNYTSRFLVQDRVNLYLLLMLLNGNLVIPARIAKFTLFVNCFNIKHVSYYKPITVMNNVVRPTLNDLWVVGFTDAEGCFSCWLSNSSNATSLSYSVAQKGLEKVCTDRFLLSKNLSVQTNKVILDYLISFFGAGNVSRHSGFNQRLLFNLWLNQ